MHVAFYIWIRCCCKPAGAAPATLRFEFEKKTGAEKFGAGGMEASFIYERQKVGEGEIARTIPFRYSAEESVSM